MHGFCGRDPIHLPGIHSSLILCCVAGAVVWEGGHSPKMQASSQGYKGLQLRSNVHAYKCVKCNDFIPGPSWDIFHNAYRQLVVYFDPNSGTQVPQPENQQAPVPPPRQSYYLQPGNTLKVYGLQNMPDRRFRERVPESDVPDWCKNSFNTEEIIDVPVVASDGYTYELEDLKNWYKGAKENRGVFKSMRTNEEMLPFVVANHEMYDMIGKYVKTKFPLIEPP